MGGTSHAKSSSAGEGVSQQQDLDLALLESLFYDEMMMITDNNSTHLLRNSSILSSHSQQQQPAHVLSAPEAGVSNVNAVAEEEKKIMQDFGVATTTTVPQRQQQQNTQHYNHMPVNTAAVPATATSHGIVQNPLVPSTSSLDPNLQYSSHQQQQQATEAHQGVAPAAAAVHNSLVSPAHIASSSTTTASGVQSPGATAIARQQQTPPEGSASAKLVKQFATLASRLDINVPPDVLEALMRRHAASSSAPKSVPATTAATAAANSINPGAVQGQVTYSTPAGLQNHSNQTAATVATMSQNTTTTSSSYHPPAVAPYSSVYPQTHHRHHDQRYAAAAAAAPPVAIPASVSDAPSVRQIEDAASAAIEATERRKRFPSPNENDNNNSSSNNSNKPKRRRKLRLPEAEAKLSQLMAENAMLNSHVSNISKKTSKIDETRDKAEKRLQTLVETNAPSDQVDAVISEYTEMFADYGRRRQHELNFHLEQLRRLANPEGFTKMGLWALGRQGDHSRSSNNKISSIIGKELGMTKQQKAKVLEERAKMQDISSNVNETLSLLEKLKDICEQKNKVFHRRMSRCREILSPRQCGLFMLWINDNTDVLGKVFPGWNAETPQFKAMPRGGTHL